MKIKTRYMVLSLMVVILLVVPGMLFALDGVYFSKPPQSVKIPMALKTIPRAPLQLTLQNRLAAVNTIRNNINLTALLQAPPAHVILTPDSPKSGQSSYMIDEGQNVPDPIRINVNSSPYSRIRPYTMLWFFLNTISGKTYMVDLSVGNAATINLQGIYGGNVNVVNGHVIVGFTANSSYTIFWLVSASTSFFDFYRCELTLVN